LNRFKAESLWFLNRFNNETVCNELRSLVEQRAFCPKETEMIAMNETIADRTLKTSTRVTEVARPAARSRFPLWDRLRDYFSRRRTERRLALMSPRMLADIGIDPADIAGGVERKVIETKLDRAGRERLAARR
jgi:uncharacterized protein YjiS (DUF1127 family)